MASTNMSGVPRPLLPDRADWLALYDKAWELTQSRIVRSDVLPAGAAYNDYPDNGYTYVWDACFCIGFQRYAAPSGAHPCLATLDNFYARQFTNGYIPRCYRVTDFSIRPDHAMPCITGTNAPLFAWAEWRAYEVTGDAARLRHVLPVLVRYYDWLESVLQVSPGRYAWDGEGSGWDNINWDQGEDAIVEWVDLPALQACAAEFIARIADVSGCDDLAKRFRADLILKQRAMERYWDQDTQWYRSRAADGRFTRKVAAGFWPVFARLVTPERIRRMIDENLFNPERFLTEPMPLPTIARDEPGYNRMGEYWKGGVWINISYMIIDALDRHGFVTEARDLATRTLDGMYRTYAEWDAAPHTLWEAYAPEYPAPASHKKNAPDQLGGVRGDFGGWACNLINLLIETHLGFQVNAPQRELRWDIRTGTGTGIEDLRLANIATSLRVTDGGPQSEQLSLEVIANNSYMLLVRWHGVEHRLEVRSGRQSFEFNRLALQREH